MKPILDLPDDPALPALAALRTAGLGAVLPTLELASEPPAQLRVCGYTPGSRVTLDAQVGQRRIAIKVYADDAEREVALYQALATAGFGEGGRAGARVPPLLAWEPALQVLAIGWLDGPPANQLVKEGQGRRAGELAARWMWSAAAAPVRLGPTVGVAQILVQAGKSVARLAAAERGLGAAAKGVALSLAATPPPDTAPRLVHGTLYARHILDVGGDPGVPGVIDWQRFGQGPVELDAGVFLATLTRLRRRHKDAAAHAARAEEAFLAGTRGLLEPDTLGWYRAAALLHLAARLLKRDEPAAARPIVDEAARLVKRAPVVPRANALELVLRALSTRPATPEELDEIRRLLS